MLANTAQGTSKLLCRLDSGKLTSPEYPKTVCKYVMVINTIHYTKLLVAHAYIVGYSVACLHASLSFT